MSGRPPGTDSSEFDTFRDTYESDLNDAVAFAGQDADVYMAAKADVLVDLAQAHAGRATDLAVLDVGCGTGTTDQHLLGRLGSITGVDVSSGMIERARERNPSVSYESYDGNHLPYSDESFDLVFAICVVHHVLPTSWGAFVDEMKRVTKHHGLVVIFEHNPLNPVTRFVVNRCAFDRDAVLLSQWACGRLLRRCGLELIETRNILFVPWRNSVVSRAERALRALPLGAQYAVVGRRT